jgi:hypothetical protein
MSQHKAVYEAEADEPVSSVVTRAIADAKDVDPIDLDERLYDHVDPSALDQLFDAKVSTEVGRDGLVSFSMAGYRVEIEGNREVVLTPLFDSPRVADEASS